MTEFLTAKRTSSYIEDIIREAKEALVLISPYLKLSEEFFQRLEDADRREVNITLMYREGELKPAERRKLEQLKNLSLAPVENLHANCYFNEESMVITSMNLYEYSESNNWEMGILIRKQDDARVFQEAIREVESIFHAAERGGARVAASDNSPQGIKSKIYSSVKARLGGLIKSPDVHKTRQEEGFCIRCRLRMPYDLDHPLCSECYSEWAKMENPDYEEFYCHTCGRPELTTVRQPQCESCSQG